MTHKPGTLAAVMSLFVSSLNSGSNGNCYYVGNEEEAILVDGGISRRETEKRMKRLGLTLKKVKAIFVTHEHGDHIHGVPGICKKHRIPVYITGQTLQHGRVEIPADLIKSFKDQEEITIGNLRVKAFRKIHDAADPHSFLVSSNSVNVGIFTDIGSACEQVKSHFAQCHAAFLESNYDEDLLESGGYPVSLKNRIRGGMGHLSNKQALELFLSHGPSFMTHLFLSHLSQDNNHPRLVKSVFEKLAGRTEIVVTSRKKETKLYHIRSSFGRFKNIRPMMTERVQLSLF
jgi:phosphoribosyl 1,2-cyclic phosphodiesterase